MFIKKKILLFVTVIILVFASFEIYTDTNSNTPYRQLYNSNINKFVIDQQKFIDSLQSSSITTSGELNVSINRLRIHLKTVDFWLRYLHPLAYKKINAPLPVEWETEVFEKFEKPYKREGAGLTLAYLYVNETKIIVKDSLVRLIEQSLQSTKLFLNDSIAEQLNTYDHFYLCNRLFLLNLSAIYTTGFECPNTKQIIEELNHMLSAVNTIYKSYNLSFKEYALSEEYLLLYKNTIAFVNAQPKDYEKFDHYKFIKDFVNPLFKLNQQMIVKYNVRSKSWVDYTLNNNATSIFDKKLFQGQNVKGVYYKVKDSVLLSEIASVGKLLFYDPILSGNNKRSCVSCHNPDTYLTDTLSTTSLQFDNKGFLSRNTPSLVNVVHNHLIMLDGKFLTLQQQTKSVMTNPLEMNCKEQDVLLKVLSCKTYKKAFKKFAKYTGTPDKVNLDHIVSAITFYYSKYSYAYSNFDNAMDNKESLNSNAIKGFNLVMSKAQCATCHFIPAFNGIKPPFVSNEFEVIGIPAHKKLNNLSVDSGRYLINPAKEMLHAFRTPTLRNSAHTKPYMHNGVFDSLEEVIEFYNVGGGSGKKMEVNNQTLSSDSLHLTETEKQNISSFIRSLSEKIIVDSPPIDLPWSSRNELGKRKPGGEY